MSAPPLPSKTKSFTSSGPPTFSKPLYSTGTFPGKVKAIGVHLRPPELHSSHSNTLPLPNKQESPPAAAVRPYSPDLSDVPPPVLQKPQTLAASSIYSMYTQRATPGKGYQLGGQGTLSRSQTRGNDFLKKNSSIVQKTINIPAHYKNTFFDKMAKIQSIHFM